MSCVKKAIASAAVGLFLSGGVVATTATPANAAVTCNMLGHNLSGGYKVMVPTWNGSYGCELRRYNSGGGVSALQSALRNCNLKANIAVDGNFGPGTKSALIAFQRSVGIDPDGVYGAQTRARLKFWGYRTTGNSVWGCRALVVS